MAILTSRARGITMWAISGLLAALYLFAGGTKLAGMPMHVEHFAQWGYPDWFRLFVGAWEVVFGLLVLVPRFAAYAAGALAVGMLGAVYTEVFRGVPGQAVVPLVLFGILVGLLWLRVGRPPSRASWTHQRVAH
jgi:putative oxidoreductase